MPASSSDSPYLEQARLEAIARRLAARHAELFDALGADAFRSRRMVTGPCPVHGGDNPGALNFYPEGEQVPGYWKCWTRGCQRHFKATAVGFVRGALSHARLGWSRPGDPCVPWKEAVDWSCQFLGVDLEKVEADVAGEEKRRFVNGLDRFLCRPAADGTARPLTRDDVRRWLVRPDPYFLGRGFSAELLDRYDVGAYPAPGRPLSDRSVVPVYDESGRKVLGFTGRSVFDPCPSCGRWHRPGACPSRGDRAVWGRSAKWYNHGFEREGVLFNWWFAREAVRRTRAAVLVEGPMDAVRLAQAGVDNAVALMGAGLSDRQQVLLECSGATDLVLLLDGDRAGGEGADGLARRLGRLFRLHRPALPCKDPGDADPAELGRLLGPLLQRISQT